MAAAAAASSTSANSWGGRQRGPLRSGESTGMGPRLPMRLPQPPNNGISCEEPSGPLMLPPRGSVDIESPPEATAIGDGGSRNDDESAPHESWHSSSLMHDGRGRFSATGGGVSGPEEPGELTAAGAGVAEASVARCRVCQ